MAATVLGQNQGQVHRQSTTPILKYLDRNDLFSSQMCWSPLGLPVIIWGPFTFSIRVPISVFYSAVPWRYFKKEKRVYLRKLKCWNSWHMRRCSWRIKKELSTQYLVTGLAWHPEYHLVTETTSRIHLIFFFLEASVFCQGAGGLRKPHDSPWDLPWRDHCSRGVRASVSLPCSAGAAATSGSSSPFQEQTPSARKHDCSARSMSKLTFCWVCLILDKQLASEPELKIAFNM